MKFNLTFDFMFLHLISSNLNINRELHIFNVKPTFKAVNQNENHIRDILP